MVPVLISAVVGWGVFCAVASLLMPWAIRGGS